MFIPRAEEFAHSGTLLKSLGIFPCAAWAKRWKAAPVGKKIQAFPCASWISAENFSSSHQSYESVSVPRLMARSRLVKQLRAKIRPSRSRACTSRPRILSRRTSPAFRSSAEMLAVAGTKMVQSTVPERSENAHFGCGGNFVVTETAPGFVDTSIVIWFNRSWLYALFSDRT